jgi:hypothetical protein
VRFLGSRSRGPGSETIVGRKCAAEEPKGGLEVGQRRVAVGDPKKRMELAALKAAVGQVREDYAFSERQGACR